jgi:hypothetical protein
MLGSNHLLQQTKQKKLKAKNKDAPRKTYRIQSNKNSVLKDDLIFIDEEGVPQGIPKL